MRQHYFLRSALAALTASALCLSLAACGSEPHVETTAPIETTAATQPPAPTETEPTVLPTEPAETVPEITIVPPDGLEELRERMGPSAAMAGVLCLGYLEEGTFHENWTALQGQEYLMEYPFIGSIPEDRIAVNDGGEIYCIIPGDPNASVTVTAWDAETETAGEVLYDSTTGDPFLVQGNVSDIMPNLAISITNSNGESMVNYHPYISLQDGSISTNTEDGALVLDLSFPQVPEGSILCHFNLYLPNEDFTAVEAKRMHIIDLDQYYLMDLLIENRLIPETVRLLSMEMNENDLILEVSADFAEYVSSFSAEEQNVVVTSFACNWLSFSNADALILSIEGQPLVTQYHSFDGPLTFPPVS